MKNCCMNGRSEPGKSGCPVCAGMAKERRTERYAAILRDQWKETS